MGNQASLPCCAVPKDKYEVSELCNAKQDAAVAASTEAAPSLSSGKGTSSEGADDVPATKIGGAFATTNPMDVAPELAPQQGLPYQYHVCGPPPPPCDDLRLRTINALKSAGGVRMDADAIDAPPDPEIASILKLVQSIFEAPAALVALFDDRRIFVRDAEGAFKRGDFPWRWSFCGWTMASKNHQIMVIPDATKDARFCNNAMVRSGPGVRFYCGTPLVASNGHRIGTLCFADVRPREFDASRCVVLNNLAELVVRHLEKDIALQLRAHDNNSLVAAYGNLRRTLDCFEHCVALVDTGCAGWRVLFVNNPCCKALGFGRDALQGSYISRLMTDVSGAMLPTDEQELAAEKGNEIQVTARFSDAILEEMDEKDIDEHGGKAAVSARRFVLTFRPASREDIDGGAISIGVPSFIPALPKVVVEEEAADDSHTDGDKQRRPDRLFFMQLQDAAKLEAERAAAQAKAAAEAKASGNFAPGNSSATSSAFSHDKELSEPPESISGLTMGHLLGKGAYGSVYYGMWYGSPVAVKIIEEELPPGVESVAPPIEAILSKELRHPHIVGTLRCARRIVGPSGSSHAVSGSIASAVAALRRGGDGANLAADGSGGAFSDDTARVSRSIGSGGGSYTSGGVSCVASRRRGGVGGGGTVSNSANSNPDSGWLQSSLGTRQARPNPHSSGGVGSHSSSSQAATTVSPDSNGDTTTPSSNLPSTQPSGLEAGNSQAVSELQSEPTSGLHANASDGPAYKQPSATPCSTSEACAGESAANGACDPRGSSSNSEEYDAFDVGRDSYVSPFLLPPGSQTAGDGGGGASGLPAHSGHSGNRSEKWQVTDVLIRHQTWLIMEYCDRGCLQDAVDRGWLRTSPSIDSSAPRMDAVLATAIELASALSFLHSKDIVHGDLSAWNVMLCTSGSTASIGGRGFVAKIADFGLARHLDIRTKIETRTYGTLTHMPAETLRDGVISKAVDVYSLGVLMWQMFTSSRPWAGLRHGQIIVMVVTQSAQLRFPPNTPSAYEELAMKCMASDPSQRPAVESVLAELEAMRKMC